LSFAKFPPAKLLIRATVHQMAEISKRRQNLEGILKVS
jgi:hypothetical protein